MQVSVKDIARRLDDQVASLAAMLLPGGQEKGREWVAGIGFGMQFLKARLPEVVGVALDAKRLNLRLVAVMPGPLRGDARLEDSRHKTRTNSMSLSTKAQEPVPSFPLCPTASWKLVVLRPGPSSLASP